MTYCKKYELDQARTHLLLSELESIQRNQTCFLSPEELKEIRKTREKQRLSKYKGESKSLVLSLVLKMIGSDALLLKFLMLSRSNYKDLKQSVYRQALLLSQPERLPIKRVPIWNIILKIRENTRDYEAFKQKVMEDPSVISSVEEVIELDVMRSAHNMTGVDSKILTNVLKTYAYYNPEIEYCQGMNFIAGLLLMVFKDEAMAFKALQELVDKFKMAELFNIDLPKLKLYFYQLDRLVNIILPDLHEHLREEQINSSYFASAWFITIFTNSLKQQTPGEQVSENLLQLWDYFLVAGWKAILKMGLYVLKESQTELKQMSFEDILNDITEKPKQLLCTQGVKLRPLQGQVLEGNNHTVYQILTMSFNAQTQQSDQRVPSTGLSYYLLKLEREFQESHKHAAIDRQQKTQQKTLRKKTRQK